MPSEAEWEYACRAGKKTWYSWGVDPNDAYAHANVADGALEAAHPNTTRYQRAVKLGADQGDGVVYTSKAARYKPNPWGLYDMHGNVWEWCSDWIVKSYAGLERTDPQGPASGVYRVLRGGSAWMDESNCRSANRVGHSVGARRKYRGIHGFRVVVESAGID